MRVLFTTVPDKSVFLSMVPLAWALRTAGHEVRVASQPALVDHITGAGLTAVPVGRNTGFWRVTGLDPAGREALRDGLPSPYHAAVRAAGSVDWGEMKAGYQHGALRWHGLDNFPMMAGLVQYAQHWQPDLVIWEPTTYAGAIAAKACGAAHARLLWSIDVFGVTREHYLRLNAQQPPDQRDDPLADWLAGYARKHGNHFTEDMTTGHFTIDQLPPSLAMTADLPYLHMQYTPYGGAATVPKWLWKPPQRPRVALTLGTTATDRFAGYTLDIQETLDALSDLDLEIIATIAEPEQTKLTRIPANTQVHTYVPLQALVPTCTAVINHAGPGTLLTTAHHAIPQLTIPWDFDEPELARRTAHQGTALVIPADHATGTTIRESLQRLLHEPHFRQHATHLRDEIHAQPTPHQLIPQLEELTTKYRAR